MKSTQSQLGAVLYVVQSDLDVEPYQAHKFNSVALRNDPVPQQEIEPHFSVDNLILKMNILETALRKCGDVC